MSSSISLPCTFLAALHRRSHLVDTPWTRLVKNYIKRDIGCSKKLVQHFSPLCEHEQGNVLLSIYHVEKILDFFLQAVLTLLVWPILLSSTEDISYPSTPPKYEYEWQVNDNYSKNNYGQTEERDGSNTVGSYFVLLPDGRTQRVSYSVDPYGGSVYKYSKC